MKHMKKIASLLLALVVLMSLTATAFAATVTIPTEGILKDHSFTAYQIFTGREENGVLSDVQWGDGINSADFLTALKRMEDSKFTSCTTAAEVANVLSANNTDTALANAVAKLAYANKTGSGTALTAGETTLADGYYLIVDTTTDVGADSAYNAALLQVVGNINITVKTDAPTVEKKVLEGSVYQDTADYNIGDAVPFRLIGTVPDMNRYETYKYVFHDTLSAGLTLNGDTIKVYVASDKEGTDKTKITGWTKTVDGQSFTISFNDLKGVSGVSEGKYIIVEYTATLNQDAVIGNNGNANTVKLEYSNKPDQSGEGNPPTGETPEDEVIVFTYELDTTKVASNNTNTKLQGAEFVLLNVDKSKVAIVDSNSKVTRWENVPAAGEDGTVTYHEGSKLTSGADGLFKVIGLDAGTYYLKETKAPAGYNMLTEEITVVITATDDGQKLTALSVTADNQNGTGDVNSGIVGITIANNPGSTLPETGGMGTTLFYAVGGVLVVAAIIFLIARKRTTSK